MARYDLTDFEWRVIAPLLTMKPRGVPRVDDRRVLNGIFWTLRSGSPWRDLPERYGPYTTVYNRFNRWRKAGIWGPKIINSPISNLILSRSKQLGLSRTELVRRCGYTNISKGHRRLEQLLDGEFQSTRGLLQALPPVLEVPAHVVAKAVEHTQRHFRETEEAAYRSSFVPHAIILTERRRPEPIFMAAVIGVDRLIRVDLDLSEKPVSFVDQALQGARDKLLRWKSQALPAFGRPTGVLINYSPDQAVEFDLQGKPVLAYDHAYRPGKASLSISRGPVSEGEMASIFQQA